MDDPRKVPRSIDQGGFFFSTEFRETVPRNGGGEGDSVFSTEKRGSQFFCGKGYFSGFFGPGEGRFSKKKKKNHGAFLGDLLRPGPRSTITELGLAARP